MLTAPAPTTNRVLVPTTLAAPPTPRPGLPVRDLHGASMGTTWCVRCCTLVERRLLQAGIESVLARVIAEMSGWEAGSDLSRFNRLPAGAALLLPPGFRHVMGCALALATVTRGAFDPTIGPLVDAWGFGPVPAAAEGPPSDLLLATARARVGWRRLGFDAATGRLTQPGGIALDLSGIAKGHAVDRVGQLLESAGIGDYLVEIGGELRGRGLKPDGTPWWVRVEQVPSLVVALHGLSVATSGDQRRRFVHGGRIFGHTIDPRTGWPIGDALASVTVLHPRCIDADALATALAVLGPRAGMDHAVRLGLAALFLLRGADGRLTERRSPAFEAMLA